MSTSLDCEGRSARKNYNKTTLAVLVASLALGLGGCLDTSSSSSSSVPGDGSLPAGDDVGDTDIPNDTENAGDQDVDSELDGDSDNQLVGGTRPGVYTFALGNLVFRNFQADEAGFVGFELISVREGSGDPDFILWRDQLVMDDPRNNAVDGDPPQPIHKVYVQNKPNVSQYFNYRSQLIPLDVSNPGEVSVNYSMGLSRTSSSPDESSPWHGAWEVTETVVDHTCDPEVIGSSEPEQVEIRVIGEDVFIGQNTGPYSWQSEFLLEDDGTITVSQEAMRWLDIGDNLVLDFDVIWSQTDDMTGAVEGDAFSIEYRQSVSRPDEGICTSHIELAGVR